MLWREVDEFTSWWVNKLLVKEGSRRVNKLLVIKENSFSCYSVFLCKQLVHSSTRWLVYLLTMLLCLLFTLSTSNLLTCLLVDLSTYHVTLSFIYPVYKQLVDLSTRWLVNKKILYLAFSINFAIFANCLIHMYHMFVEIIDILYYEFKL